MSLFARSDCGRNTGVTWARSTTSARTSSAKGACATSGGIQALKNFNNSEEWLNSIYADPQYISTLDTVEPVAHHVRVDYEIWGCPISRQQLLTAIGSLLNGVTPKHSTEKVCMECKRNQTVCQMVVNQTPCLGPVTRAGCGAICPEYGRHCYSCYGPAVDSNTTALSNRLLGLGYTKEEIVKKYSLIHSNSAINRQAVTHLAESKDNG